jgi:uncharacterized protein with HEPN domain
MTDQGKKFLSDIVRAIDLISLFMEGISDYDSFYADLKTQSAVERQLVIIGEAVNKFDKLFPQYSLQKAKKIVGFRNRIVHAYDSVDQTMIWAIIQNHLEPLKIEIEEKMNQGTS